MNKKIDKKRLVYDIFAAQDDDIQCDKASALIMQSVEARLSDEISRKQYPALWRHFAVCFDCAHEYEMLLRLVQLEADARLPQPGQIPPLPGKDQGRTWATIKETVTKTITGFTPMPQVVVRYPEHSGRGSGFEPMMIELESGRGQIELAIDVNAANPVNYDLICTVEILDAAWDVFLEGTLVQLHRGVDGPVVKEKSLDELGELAFTNLTAGEYTLRVSLGGQAYVVTNITLPAQE